MDQNETSPPLRAEWQRPPEPTTWDRIRKFLAPLGVVLVLVLKFFAKLKVILLPALKFIPVILKTGGTMFVSMWVYAMYWGWQFAVGFVLLIFIHECGHLLAAKKLGLKVSAPMFIPFVGALITLKENPTNAWVEAQVGIGGPMLGTLGAGISYLVFLATGQPLFGALAYTGFWINLFNMIPIGFLDGGRIVTALSPWLWVAGFPIMLGLAFQYHSFIIALILIASAPRLFFLFRRKNAAELRYFEITPAQRWTIAIMYFGLIALLALGMHMSYVPHETLR